ncbi:MULTISPECIES: FemAB family XrtA/PEP-CTERM system-associated protein [unclassified Janthinobacterium]|uniref:FemAB family XrtA/PEP-CTERM system-associated protein n=1 Tax=unclassified Janthinobacterium TaxID=2610881 RepID=UPI001832A7FC|nr:MULTISPECIES: FemAB family XrtA/PEP-CTERM system-associated protein [unclassified Janthinobacterium]MBB5369816.1 FemAB-related protein (PEP-CTERM system-associated) [Janthinobacterium sp. K2C7]MBB5382622.1 FemAB-related protein (PEP-CTERM system-associated) [Janthinobacterium sp. K2Li3]MBB5384607.1 FemAB-related protein (PEP-CTERM system-associated) [Janthinobacterium sp. K2E3]
MAVSSHAPPRPASALDVRRLQAHDHVRWDDFVQTCPEATFFHRAGWQTVMEQGFGHDSYFLYAEQAGNIVGVLPLAHIRSRLFGNALVSLPFCVYGGIASSNRAARLALDEAAQMLAQQLHVGHLEYRQRDQLDSSEQPGWLGKPLYATFRRSLQADEQDNLLAIPRKQRAVVRKGSAAGLHSSLDDDLDRFFALYAGSLHRLGTPVFARRHFALLRTVFGDDCSVMTVCQGSQAQASVMTFYFRDEVLPYYGGGSVLARDTGANDFMYWELMRRAGARGYRLFDFGRSKVGTGAYDFKKNWGFTAQPLPYAYKLVAAKSLPDTNPLNPKYRWFIRAWRRLPLPLANLLGPHILRQLG